MVRQVIVLAILSCLATFLAGCGGGGGGGTTTTSTTTTTTATTTTTTKRTLAPTSAPTTAAPTSPPPTKAPTTAAPTSPPTAAPTAAPPSVPEKDAWAKAWCAYTNATGNSRFVFEAGCDLKDKKLRLVNKVIHHLPGIPLDPQQECAAATQDYINSMCKPSKHVNKTVTFQNKTDVTCEIRHTAVNDTSIDTFEDHSQHCDPTTKTKYQTDKFTTGNHPAFAPDYDCEWNVKQWLDGQRADPNFKSRNEFCESNYTAVDVVADVVVA